MSSTLDFVNTDCQRLACEIGTDWIKSLTYTDCQTGLPLDLTGWDARMQVRAAAGSPTIVLDLRTYDAVDVTFLSTATPLTMVINGTTCTASDVSDATRRANFLAAVRAIPGVSFVEISATDVGQATRYVYRLSGHVSYALPGYPTLSAVWPRSITFDDQHGTMTLRAAASLTNSLTAGMYVYDLIVTDGDGIITRQMEGRFQITSRVTIPTTGT